MNAAITEEEREGVKIIVYLQKQMGIDETEEQALKGWRGMSCKDRENTRSCYALLTFAD